MVSFVVAQRARRFSLHLSDLMCMGGFLSYTHFTHKGHTCKVLSRKLTTPSLVR